MVKPEAQHQSPRYAKSGDETNQSRFDQSLYQRNLFVSMALNMTWQLALVVVVPIIGGFKLDEHYHTAPWLTIAGVGLAAIGVFGVLSKVVADAKQRSGFTSPEDKQ